MTNLRDVNIHSGTGVPLTSTAAGVIDTHEKDVHIEPINEFFHRHVGATTTLNGSTIVGATQIVVASGTGLANGDFITIDDGAGENRLHKITSGGGTTTLVLDGPLDSAHLTGVSVEEVEPSMVSAVGTLSSPISYVIEPSSGEKWHIKRIILELTDGTAGDDSKFGGIPALANGVVLRLNNNGVYRTLTVWKSNGGLKEDMYDIIYDDRASAAGVYAVSGRWTFDKLDIAVSLDADTSDKLEILIQDDLTALTTFRIKAQGHVDA